MRFKDFQIVINGEIGDGEREGLASSLNSELTRLFAPQAAPETKEEKIAKIENNEAQWSPPLQQQLDAVKIGTGVSAHEKLSESVTICESCGRLVIVKDNINESTRARLDKAWQNVMKSRNISLIPCNKCLPPKG